MQNRILFSAFAGCVGIVWVASPCLSDEPLSPELTNQRVHDETPPSEETLGRRLFQGAMRRMVTESQPKQPDAASDVESESRNDDAATGLAAAIETALKVHGEFVDSTPSDPAGDQRNPLSIVYQSAVSVFQFSWTNVWFWVAVLGSNLVVAMANNRRNGALGFALTFWLSAHGLLIAANSQYLPSHSVLAVAVILIVFGVSIAVGLRWTIPYRWRYYVNRWKNIYREEMERFLITRDLRVDDGTLMEAVPVELQTEWEGFWSTRCKRRGVPRNVPLWQQRKFMLVTSVLFWWCSMLTVLWNEVIYDLLVGVIRHFSSDLDEETRKISREVETLTRS